MMESIFSIVNDHGTTFLDDTYQNLVLIEKRSIQITGTGSLTTQVLQFGGANPVLGLACAEGRSISVVSTYFNNGAWHAEVVIAGNSSLSFLEYFVFDLIKPPSTEFQQGLRLFNSSGQLVFDSELNYLRVIDILQGEERTQQSIAYNVKEAVVFLTPTIQQYGGGGGFSTVAPAYTLQGGHYYRGEINFGYTDTSDNGNVNTNEPSYIIDPINLILDVSNY